VPAPRALLFALLALLWAGAAAAQPKFPPLTGRVVDAAGILDPAAEARIEAKLRQFEDETTHQFVVATIPDLQGYDIADYGYQLGRAWGIGDRERNDGVVLLVAPNDRRVRLEVGYGLEGSLPDALASVIIQRDIAPAFRAGDFAGGIERGVEAVVTQLKLPPEEAAANAAAAEAARARGRGQGDSSSSAFWFWLALIFIFFILPMLTQGGKRRRRGNFPIIIWGPGWGGGGGSWSGGGGWGGGGGFGGGGGSFGGGGASGGW
jgi:uncharacterized protein